MRRRVWTTPLLFCLNVNLLSSVARVDSSEAFHYDYSLKRLKRESVPKTSSTETVSTTTDPKEEEVDMAATIPPDYTIEDEDNDATKSEHTYYNMTTYSNKPKMMQKYFVDMQEWINSKKGKKVAGATKHDHLVKSYRKATGVKISFDFPFYGHRLPNLTIATGGFLYVGDQTHSWLAATQYIAPLMANFDTVADNSTIMYGDDGQKMIVEWSNVRLRDNWNAGPFTFQVQLFKSGDIWFVYKDVPIVPQNISDAQHPCKMGISDAYLFNHRVTTSGDKLPVPQGKRVIHEYHRITIPPESITNNTVIILTALPTCLSFNTCEECSHSSLKFFQCSWCTPEKNPGVKPFCSDQIGLNRRRQEWVEGGCAEVKKQIYCDATEAPSNVTMTTTSGSVRTTAGVETSPSSSAAPSPPSNKEKYPEDIVTISPNKQKTKGEQKESGGGGLAFVTLMVLVAVSFAVWVLYAFYNPHTTSGQLLIKYRPSKWQVPSSHVRYSASVHM